MKSEQQEDSSMYVSRLTQRSINGTLKYFQQIYKITNSVLIGFKCMTRYTITDI
jgi:hypothetical protein